MQPGLVEVAVHPAGQFFGADWITSLSPAQCLAQVGGFTDHPHEGVQRVAAGEYLLVLFRLLKKVFEVALAQRLCLVKRLELLIPKLVEQVVQPVAAFADQAQERFIHQPCQLSSRAPVTASAAARSKPPRKTVRRGKMTRSSSLSRFHDCSKTARMLFVFTGRKKVQAVPNFSGDFLAG
jgi:hypothetical protein